MISTVKNIAVLLFIILSLSEPFSLFALGKKQASETKVVTDLQDKYNALAAPGIIMLPASGISAVSPELLMQIEKELFKQMVNAGKIKPVRMQNWLLTTYSSKANNPFVIMNAIKAEEYAFPLQYMGKPVLFRGGNRYYFALYVYSLQTYYPIIILRRFDILKSAEKEIPMLISSCLEELNTRLSRPVSSNVQKRIMIDEFKLDFLRLAELPSGEFEFLSAPFFEADDTILREGDDFFSRIMGYILASTGMFQTFQIGDFKEFSNAVIGNATTLVDYRMQGRIQLSGNECVLYIDIIDVRTGAKTVSLWYPLSSYSFDNIWNAYREMSVQIISKMFDKQNYGIVPKLTAPGRSFFANNMFIGCDTLENYVLPQGLHVISTGSAYGADNMSKSINEYYILLDYKSTIFTDIEGKHIWNLLRK